MITITEEINRHGAYVLKVRGDEYSTLAEIEAAFPDEPIEFHRNVGLEHSERKRLAPKIAINRDTWLEDF